MDTSEYDMLLSEQTSAMLAADVARKVLYDKIIKFIKTTLDTCCDANGVTFMIADNYPAYCDDISSKMQMFRFIIRFSAKNGTNGTSPIRVSLVCDIDGEPEIRIYDKNDYLRGLYFDLSDKLNTEPVKYAYEFMHAMVCNNKLQELSDLIYHDPESTSCINDIRNYVLTCEKLAQCKSNLDTLKIEEIAGSFAAGDKFCIKNKKNGKNVLYFYIKKVTPKRVMFDKSIPIGDRHRTFYDKMVFARILFDGNTYDDYYMFVKVDR